MVLVRGDHRVNEIKLAERARRAASAPRTGGGRASASARAGFIGPVGADVPILLDDGGRRPGGYVDGRQPRPTSTCAASSRAATSRSSAPTCARVEAGDTVGGARDPHRAGDRGRQHLQARHALLRAARRHATSTRTGAEQPVVDGLLRHRPGAHRRRRGRAVRRRAGHLVAARARAVRRRARRPRQGRHATSARPPSASTTSCATAGLDVLYDDRDVGPGEKFADAELLGCPLR